MSTGNVTNFDAVEAPLPWGRTMMEASAGTGKTYTVTTLVLRYLLQADISLQHQLIMTFTEAATMELRHRIRARLLEARAILQGGSSEDTGLLSLLASAQDNQELKQRYIKRLNQSLLGFDRAPIFTLHGFCQFALSEQGALLGKLSRPRLAPDASGVQGAMAGDVWQGLSLSWPPVLAAYMQSEGFGLDGLQRAWRLLRSNPALLKRSLDQTPPKVATDQRVMAVLEEAMTVYRRDTDDIKALFIDPPKAWLAKKKAEFKPEGMAGKLAALDELVAERQVRGLDVLVRFRREYLEEHVTKTGAGYQHHAFFDACQSVHDALCEWSTGWLLEGVRRMYDKWQLWRTRNNQCDFDDMLTDMTDAVRESDAFRAHWQQWFRVLVVDECQDTNAQQYDIVESLLHGDPDGDAQSLIYIGDPKQSIYGFRGADVMAYLGARERADTVVGLGKNYRSVPSLVDGVNHLFSRSSSPFGVERIGFQPAEAHRQDAGISDESSTLAGMRCWFAQRVEGQKELSSDTADHWPRIVADDIAGLLSRGATVEENGQTRPLTPGDFAILVRSNYQAQDCMRALESIGLPAELLRSGSVLATLAAGMVQRLLQSVLSPHRLSLLGGSCTDGWWGIDQAHWLALQDDTVGQHALIEMLHRFGRAWSQHGLVFALQEWLDQVQGEAWLLSQVGGERVLTNIWHVAEWLEAASRQYQLMPEEQLTHLCNSMVSPSDEDESTHVRPLSSQEAVHVMTIHKSKGLQFPMVYCPYLFGSSGSLSGPQVFPDDNGQWHFAESLKRASSRAPMTAMQQFAMNHQFYEQLRLVYVALTRAQSQCTVLWGAFRDCHKSAFAALAHAAWHEGQLPGQQTSQAKRPDVEWRDCIQGDARAESLLVLDMPEVAGHRYEANTDSPQMGGPLAFTPTTWVREGWHSYSSLAHGADEDDHHDAQDLQSLDVQPEGPMDAAGRLPRGAHIGNVFHGVLEDLDYARYDVSRLSALVSYHSQAFGLAAEHEDEVVAVLQRVLSAPLVQAGCRLTDLSAQACVKEMEFNLSLFSYQKGSFYKRVGGLLGLPESLAQSEADVAGFLKGYIDLVFEHDGRYFIADWKSNALGPNASAYSPAVLQHAMHRERYVAQYRLYCVALDAYLRRYVPDYRYETHFGGVYYVFLRGVTATGDTGLFFDRPMDMEIQSLRGALLNA